MIQDNDLDRKIRSSASKSRQEINKLKPSDYEAAGLIPSEDVFVTIMKMRYLCEPGFFVKVLWRLFRLNKFLELELRQQYQIDYEPLKQEQNGLILDSIRNQRSTQRTEKKGSDTLGDKYANGEAVPKDSAGRTVAGQGGVSKVVKPSDVEVIELPHMVHLLRHINDPGMHNIYLGLTDVGNHTYYSMIILPHFGSAGKTRTGKTNGIVTVFTQVALDKTFKPQFIFCDAKDGSSFGTLAHKENGLNIPVMREKKDRLIALDYVIDAHSKMSSKLGSLGYETIYQYYYQTGILFRPLVLVYDELRADLKGDKDRQDKVDRIISLGGSSGVHILYSGQDMLEKNGIPTGVSGQTQVKIHCKHRKQTIRQFIDKVDDLDDMSKLSPKGTAVFEIDDVDLDEGTIMKLAYISQDDAVRLLKQSNLPEDIFIDPRVKVKEVNVNEPANGTILGAPVAPELSYADAQMACSDPVELGISDYAKGQAINLIDKMMGYDSFNSTQANVKLTLYKAMPNMKLSNDGFSSIYHEVGWNRVTDLLKDDETIEGYKLAQLAYGVKKASKSLKNRVDEIRDDFLN